VVAATPKPLVKDLVEAEPSNVEARRDRGGGCRSITEDPPTRSKESSKIPLSPSTYCGLKAAIAARSGSAMGS
jgi:hypothetical protein